jgi:glutaminyl-tRNA synthetase
MTRDKNRSDTGPARDFVRAIIAEDVAAGKHGGAVVTRFPPEPNGYLHIGHAKSICLNFGAAADQGGVTHLRFDDTNPETEDEQYVRSIQEDVRWLGFDWGTHLYFASDYFERLYEYALELIRAGKAYVDSSSGEEIREYRGTVGEPGKPSPFRNCSVEDNLDLFGRMRAGEFADGEHVLRARIDMAANNMLMRDPVLYRIRHADHYRTGGDWCIYPLYDFTHCLSDSIEGITHSVCTLEFENNRELYDWVLDSVEVPQPQPRQYEMARLNLDYTVLSKRVLLALATEGHVTGWDDPRMPTIAGMRRRGVPPKALRNFCDMIGVAKTENRVDVAKLEYSIRDELNHEAYRVMCVLRPLKVLLSNFPNEGVEPLEAPYFPEDVGKEGSRAIPFTRELFIERRDFKEDPPKGFKRLVPGEEVRLRYGYVIRCEEVIKDDAGNVTELRCTYDPDTRGGTTPEGRKVKGTIHWVSATESLVAEVRLYDRLFVKADPEEVEEGQDFTSNLNPDSLVVLTESRIEPSVATDPPDRVYQFERTGYFVADPESAPGALVYNRTVTLKDSWTKSDVGAAGSAGPVAGAPVKRDSSDLPALPPPPRQVRPEDPDAAHVFDQLVADSGLSEAEASVLAQDGELLALFRDAFGHTDEAESLAKWVVNEVPRIREGRPIAQLPFGGAELGQLVGLVREGAISGRAAKDVLAVLASEGGDPARIVEGRGLGQVSDTSALEPLIATLIEQNGDKVAAYQGGKTGLLGFFVGQVMSETKGAADPELTQRMLREALDGG